MNQRQEMWSWIMLVIFVTILLLAGYAHPQTLKRRTEPALHEESCRDHLARVQRSLILLADPHGKIASRDKDFAQGILREAKEINPAVDGIPTSRNCSRKGLERLDVIESLLIFETAEE